MKKNIIWITVPNSCYFRRLKKEDDAAEEKDMNDCLWFEKEEAEEAELFVRNLKKWIVENYHHKERAIWLNNKWVDEVK